MDIEIADIEADFHLFDRSMHEEINRILTDRLSALLLTPSRDTDENPIREGIDRRRIVMVVNIMIDSLVSALCEARARIQGAMASASVSPRCALPRCIVRRMWMIRNGSTSF